MSQFARGTLLWNVHSQPFVYGPARAAALRASLQSTARLAWLAISSVVAFYTLNMRK